MITFLGRRLLGGFITLALFVTALFFLVNVLIPGDWTSQFIMTGEARQALQESLGIDRPLGEQFWTWISSVATLDLGVSFGGAPVWTAVRQATATTLFVFVAATAISFPLGYWMGRALAWNERPWLTIPNTAIAVMLFTAFPPAIAFLAQRGITNVLSPQTFRTLTTLDDEIWAFEQGNRFSSRPTTVEGFDETLTPPQVLWRMLMITAVLVAVVLVLRLVVRALTGRRMTPGIVAAILAVGSIVGWRLSDFGDQAFDIASSMVILIGGLVLLTYGEILLVTEAAMFDTRDEDFILTARAKGLTERAIRDRHSARAALLPVLSRLVVSVPYFLTGLVILEYVFAVQGGLGNLIFFAINVQDTPLIVGAMVIVGVVTLVLRLALEVAIAALDPRVRLGSGETP
ncbi:MAG: ABC transporter permease [Acidimicrobiia bacterium]|nr:ABC transporter permease [Acidimicrobiia bacterium]NNF88885.1 ABC transporter permease [Acidimicrobiia bacterium]NNJ48645.1 ABC transporter permease [Acidimicrobiia bacterium]NNL14273.1 ABC transporter permease [Acidimicrobiia bacterium]RZV44152.1 MAG: ABC transporter permease [Acidimicrobiia bacterium]